MADSLAVEMKRSSDAIKLWKGVLAANKPMAVPRDRKEIGEERVNRLFDEAAKPRIIKPPPRKPMAVRT